MKAAAKVWTLVPALLGRAALAQDASTQSPAAATTDEIAPVPTEQEMSPPPPLTLGRAVQTIVSGEELHRWDRYVRGFRREHNFALSAGVSRGTWTVRRFGTLTDDSGERSFSDSGVYARFQYSFHLPLYEGFGYFLGSSIGYHYEAMDKRQPFRPVAAYQLPGVLAGFVLNVNPVLRLSVGLDAYLERHNGIQERDGVGEDPEIFVTLRAYDLGAYFDVFYDLGWALRLEAHRRHLEYERPYKATGFPVNANLRKDDEWLGVGLVYHLI